MITGEKVTPAGEFFYHKLKAKATLFSLNNIFTQKQKKTRKNIEQCPTRYVLDMNRGNVKVKIIIKIKKKKF